jgi:ubiquitin-protein ligase
MNITLPSRFRKELEDNTFLNIKYINIDKDYYLYKYNNIFLQNRNNMSSIITTFTYKNKKIDIYIPNEYPFKCPYIYVNDKLLTYGSYKYPKRILNKYIELYNCPCCKNLLRKDTWSPVIHIKMILDEYLNFIDKLITIHKIYLLTKSSLFCYDIIYEITSYLDPKYFRKYYNFINE